MVFFVFSFKLFITLFSYSLLYFLLEFADASKEFFEHSVVHCVEGRSSGKLPFIVFLSLVTAVFS